MSNEALLIQIDRLSTLLDDRDAYQEEIKSLRKLTPLPVAEINATLEKARSLTQDILDKSVFVANARPDDRLVNQKRWAVIEKIFKLEEQQANGRVVSPTIARIVLFGKGKPYAMPPPERTPQWLRDYNQRGAGNANI